MTHTFLWPSKGRFSIEEHVSALFPGELFLYGLWPYRVNTAVIEVKPGIARGRGIVLDTAR